VGAVVEAWHLGNVDVELLYTMHKLTYIDALGLLKNIDSYGDILWCSRYLSAMRW
jgi:hypothetical protein